MAAIRVFAYLILLPYMFISCASVVELPVEETIPESGSSLSEIQTDLIHAADWALGRDSLVVNGRTFNLDCSGVVLAVYYRAGIDLQSYLGAYSGGGVQRLYAFMDDRQLLYKDLILAPGDMLFWDNTYDKNNDGAKNDELTHVGMVVSVHDDGTMEYIHHNYRLGIVLAKMNLNDPDNLEVNSPMRARGAEKGHAPLWLSSHLLRQAARAYEIAD